MGRRSRPPAQVSRRPVESSSSSFEPPASNPPTHPPEPHSTSFKPPPSPPPTHHRYLAFFADMNALFDLALGMYDLDLTKAVARQSQKDPREYLPFLEAVEKEEGGWKGKVMIDRYVGKPYPPTHPPTQS